MRYTAISVGAVAALAATGVLIGSADAQGPHLTPQQSRSCATAAVTGATFAFSFPSSSGTIGPLSLTQSASALPSTCATYFTRTATAQLLIEPYNQSQLWDDSPVYRLGTAGQAESTTPVKEVHPASGCLANGQRPIYVDKETFTITGLHGAPSYAEQISAQVPLESAADAPCATNTADQQRLGGVLKQPLHVTNPGYVAPKPLKPVKPVFVLRQTEKLFQEDVIEDTGTFSMRKLVLTKFRYERTGVCGGTVTLQLLVDSRLGQRFRTGKKGPNGKDLAGASHGIFGALIPHFKRVGFSKPLTDAGDEIAKVVHIPSGEVASASSIEVVLEPGEEVAQAMISYHSAGPGRQLKELILRQSGTNKPRLRVLWSG